MIRPFRNHYATLGVHAGMDNVEIRAAYLRLARVHHPDRGGDTNLFADINEAYQAIKDAPRRQAVAAYWRVVRHRCTVCQGDGCAREGQGFTAVKLVGCVHCGGAGWL